MVELQVSSSIYNCELKLERRITYIKGNSGVGKTTLLNIINGYNRGDPSIKIKCNRMLNVMNNLIKPSTLIGYEGTVVFLDDDIATESVEFGNSIDEIVQKYDIYLVVIGRVDSHMREKWSCGYSVLECIKDGVNHYFKPVNMI